MDGFEIGGTGDGLDLFVVLPPAFKSEDFNLSRIEVDSKHFTLFGVALLARRAAEKLILLIFDQMLIALHRLFLLTHDLLLSLILLRLNGFALSILNFLEVIMNLWADHLSFLEIFHNFKANRRDFAKFSTQFFTDSPTAHSTNSAQFLKNAFLEEIILE